MKNTQWLSENRREHMRVNTRLHFCVSIMESRDKDTGAIKYSGCFSTSTTDISLGGMCFAHKGKVQLGTLLELASPQKTSRMDCLACDKSYALQNDLDLNRVYAKVVWINETHCGIRFLQLSRRNENILSKYIWDMHLDTVRDNKDQVVRHRKF